MTDVRVAEESKYECNKDKSDEPLGELRRMGLGFGMFATMSVSIEEPRAPPNTRAKMQASQISAQT